VHKDTDDLTVIFALLGSALIKADRKTLVKKTLDVLFQKQSSTIIIILTQQVSVDRNPDMDPDPYWISKSVPLGL